MTEELERLRNQIIKLVEEKGYPGELGALAADSLGSEKAMTRMIGWLSHSEPGVRKILLTKCLLSVRTGTTGVKRRKPNFTSKNIISICGT